MIQIYKSTNTNYNANGNATLTDINSCTIEQELNGQITLFLEVEYDKEKRWQLLEVDNVIKVKTNWSDNEQLFRITEVNKNIDTIQVTANHIFFDLVNEYCKDLSNDDAMILDTGRVNCQNALNKVLQYTNYTGHSDIVGNYNRSRFDKKNVIEAINGEDENSLVNRYGGELYIDNFDIYLNKEVGSNNGVSIEYGKNLTGLECDVSMEGVYTRIIPIGYNGLRLTGTTPWIDSSNINKYSNIRETVIEYSDVKVGTEDGEFATEDLARKELIRLANLEFTENKVDLPNITLTINFEDLSKYEEYKQFKCLEKVNIGDTVTVRYKKLDIDVQVRVISGTWNVLTESWEEVTLGDYVENFYDKQADIVRKVNNTIDSNGNVVANKVSGLIDSSKAMIKAQKTVAKKQDIIAMLFEDLDEESGTYGAMCLGTMGFMISNTRTEDGEDWIWTTVGTPQGLIADAIVTGVLSNKDGSFSIDLGNSGGAKFYNNDKIAMQMRGNTLRMYNWKKNGDYIGSLGALIQSDDENKPLISFWNDTDSALSIGYQSDTDSSKVPSYILFDKYNVLGNGADYPILVYLPIKFKDDVRLDKIVFSDNASTNLGIFGYTDNNTVATIQLSAIDVNIFSNVYVSKALTVHGDLTVDGNKNCIQKTQNYGERLFYSVEDAQSFLTYTGREEYTVEKNQEGFYERKIYLDEIFKECVNLKENYIVEIYKLSFGDYRILERTKDYFILESDKEDFTFNYTIKAKRKGFEDKNMDKFKRNEIKEVK